MNKGLMAKIFFFASIVFLLGFSQYQKTHTDYFQGCKPVGVLKVDTLKMSGSNDIYLYHLSDNTLRYIHSKDLHDLNVNDTIYYIVTFHSDQIEKYQVINH